MSCSVWSRSVFWTFVGLAWLASDIGQAQAAKPASAKKPPAEAASANQDPFGGPVGPSQKAVARAVPRLKPSSRNRLQRRTASGRVGR